MERQSIDGVETAQATGISRRSVLAGIGGGTAAALLAAVGPAARAGATQEGAATGQFLVIRRYRLAPGTAIAEVVRRTEVGFVPILRQMAGFVEYLNVDLGDGEGATIGIFTGQASAEESTERAAAWVQDNFAGLVQGPPEVMAGPVLLHDTAQATTGNQASGAVAEAKEGVVRRLLAAFNAGDLAALDEIVAPNFVDRTPLPGASPDRAGLEQAVAQFRAAFPDARWTAEHLVVEGDAVAARLTFRGTHRGELLGVPPTGRQVTVDGIAIYRIADGRVAEEWAVRDLLGLLSQLGAIAPLGQSGA